MARDIENLKAALQGVQPGEIFIPAASPGIIALTMGNQYYPDREAYIHAIADAMREEYEAISTGGFLLQLDCPDLAVARQTQFADASIDEFRRQGRDHAGRRSWSDQ